MLFFFSKKAGEKLAKLALLERKTSVFVHHFIVGVFFVCYMFCFEHSKHRSNLPKSQKPAESQKTGNFTQMLV